MRSSNSPRRRTRAPFMAASLFFAGCQGAITVDLATEPPADANVQQIVASLRGLEFLDEDGGTETIEFSSGEWIDLTDYANGDPLRVLTSEQLSAGEYVGVRLYFDEDDAEDAHVVDASGARLPMSLADGEYAEIDFTVEEEEDDEDGTSSESLTLTLDLRQSLRLDEDEDEYALTPVLRSVQTDNAAQIEGAVDVDCDSDGTLADGAAVYLFEGQDATPDDRDGEGIEPYATAAVTLDSTTGVFTYVIRFVPAGDYTLALACEGDEEDPSEDDEIEFQANANIEVDSAETVEVDLAD